MSIKRLNNHADTIVEVLISIAVVSMVLAGAFVSSSRSLNGSQQSQERTEAVKFTEEQLERLKSYSATAAASLFTDPPASFCFDSVGSLQPLPLIGVLATDDFSLYVTPGCLRSPSDRYHVAITRTANNTFSATTRWDRAGGGGRDEVKIIYRVYQ